MSADGESSDVKAPQDWSCDNFPTSARKVFIGWGLMVLGIITLCTIVYMSSDHSQRHQEEEQHRIAAKQALSGMEDTTAKDEEDYDDD